jgi:excisionase family DNA binding protein
MKNYLTLEETAQQLKVSVADIRSLVDQGKLRAISVGNNIRVPEAELEKLPVTCAAGPSPIETLPENSRLVYTRKGKPFRVSGSIAGGAEIWPGKMRYPIRFRKPFMDALLARFPEGEVAVGGSFDDPSNGSLGEFIQQNLPTKMNPAVYVAALLIDEGYADESRRGYIRRRAARERGKSLNEVAIEALARGAGITGESRRQRDLGDIAGTWCEDPAFDSALAAQDTIDEEMWK